MKINKASFVAGAGSAVLFGAALIPNFVGAQTADSTATATATATDESGAADVVDCGPGGVGLRGFGGPIGEDLATALGVSVEDLQAAGLSPTQLARQVEEALSAYIREPRVTVIVQSFAGTFETQVRVVGEALRPTSISYRQGLTLLDAMITVGGLTDFAAGNRASIVRVVDGEQRQYRARLDDLLRDGDISANVALLPGDILIIPESWY